MSGSRTSNDPWVFCDAILPDVSRSFALIIPQCPEPIDRAMCVAYLICRLADTVEDEPALEKASRDNLYDALLEAVDEPSRPELALAFKAKWPMLPAGHYGRLIEGSEHVLAAYATLDPSLQGPIRQCVKEMIAGMRQVHPRETHDDIDFVCRDMDDLEQYCHYVAGTVGVMSTGLFEAHFAPGTFEATDAWREQGRRLGLGLQMTNIIKDCESDADRRVSYIPPGCIDFRQSHYQLLHIGRADLIGRCIAHLDAGLSYALAIPTHQAGIRRFLLGSLLPAIATLEVASPGREPAPKIDRTKMAEIFDCIERNIDHDDALRAWYDEHRRRTLASLNSPVPDQP